MVYTLKIIMDICDSLGECGVIGSYSREFRDLLIAKGYQPNDVISTDYINMLHSGKGKDIPQATKVTMPPTFATEY